MSYDVILYLKFNEFPSPGQLAQELSSAGFASPPSLDLREARGFVPMGDTGFEVSCAPITADEIRDHQNALRVADEADDEHLLILRESDTTMTFWCHDESEVAAARQVAGAIARLSRGYVCDPQTGEVTQGSYLQMPHLYR